MRVIPIILVILLAISMTSASLATQQNSGLELTTFFTGVYLEPGSSLSTTVYVKNNLSRPVDASLLADKPAGWTVEFYLMGYNVSDVFLAPGEKRGIELRITSPEDATPGEYKISILAQAENVASNPLVLTIHLLSKPTTPPLELTVPYLSLSGEPGSTLDYRFDVKNNLDKEVVVGLEVVSAPRGWVAVFKPSTYENRIISSITVKPKQKEIGLVMSVKIPSNARPGEYDINFTISAEGYVETANVIAKVTGIREYSLTTSNQLLSFEVQAGEEKNITLVIINEGTESISDIELSSIPPSGWNVEIEPEKVDVLEAESTETVTLTVRPPANTLAGDYSLRVTAYSQEAGSQRLDLRVTVTKQTYWGLIGVLVVAISVIALLLVFWRFGRP
jgi:uncharacterized membrane protein